jgi:SAM-dependent methyltransferase
MNSRAQLCPACGGPETIVFHAQRGLPVNSCLLVDSRTEALAFPTGDLELAVCPSCGFIFNQAFDAELVTYSSDYEETQGCSSRFQEFSSWLAGTWIERYALQGKRLLEIGCGKGEFLATMCELGGCTGIGIDPSAMPERLVTCADVTLVPESFSTTHAAFGADVILCRHTLEHIAPVADFLREVREVIGDRMDTVVLFELPDAARVLAEGAFWDVYYEHCSYFTAGSLGRLFRACGFTVLNIELAFDGQYLLLEAMPAGAASNSPHPLEEAPGAVVAVAARFKERFSTMIAGWRTELAEQSAAGHRTALWGGGSKAVSYLTNLPADEVAYAVDINPRKQGRFLAGSGCRVVGPQDLPKEPPDVVIAMNPVYATEIQAELDRWDLRSELRSV